MKAKSLPAVEILRELFEYDAERGVLTWRCWNRGGQMKKGERAGSPTPAGYVSVSVNKSAYLIHRIIWKIVMGVDPCGDLDHINGIRSDNRWVNLREASRSQNAANRKKPCDNRSGFKGVSFKRNGWEANIIFEGKFHYLGRYKTAEEAHAAYRCAAQEKFGAFARMS